MGRIQSSTGLITGIPIEETVNKLMALEARSRDTLVSRQKVVGAEQAAIGDLTALVLGVQFAARRFTAEVFGQKKVVSSQPAVLTATAATTAANGQYKFVPVQLAQSHQAASSGLVSRDQALGAGTLTIRSGGHIDPAVGLADLNGGDGVSRGTIKITDRSGASASIDLQSALSIEDVLRAINGATDISVQASTQGDRIVLRDSSGGTGNLRVQEVGGGTTASDLGLASINVAANQATGGDIVQLFAGIRLDQLRDGNGFSLRPELPDLAASFRDGSTLEIDLDPTTDSDPTTLGDIVNRLNAADPTRLQAQISADGKRIQLKDLTTGGDDFAVTSPLDGSLAHELGLTAAAVGDTITGSRLISGLKTTLLGSLQGGQGLGGLGQLNLTDRSGASATVNLASAQTLDDVIDAINNTGLGITASYNSARNGLLLSDTTGATTSNLIVANGDTTNTATKLGVATNAAATSVNSGSLNRQVVSRGTLLSSLNNGAGVRLGSFLIKDSAGHSGAINLRVLEAKTVGDVIDAVNALSIDVEARLNDAGDGIVLIDSAGGTGKLTVTDNGAGQSAADLHLAGEGVATTVDGEPVQIIDGSTTLSITLGAEDTLDDLVEKINAAGGGVVASVLTDSAGSLRYHLALHSTRAGKAGELLIDGAALGLTFEDVVAAQDAVLQIGTGAAASLATSTSNQFQDVLAGINVTVLDTSTTPVTVSVTSAVDAAASALQAFVDNYNKLRDKLDTYTAFDADAGTKGTLFGSAETLRIDAAVSGLATGRFANDGAIRSLAELGVSISDQGKLTFDRTKLQARFQADPESVSEFFADEDRGFAAKADKLLETIVGRDNSLLVNRLQTLQRQNEIFDERITAWNARLERRRERLTNQFFKLEEIVARIQNNLTAINQIQFIKPIVSNNS